MLREVKAGCEQVTSDVKEGDRGGVGAAVGGWPLSGFQLISEENGMHKV